MAEGKISTPKVFGFCEAGCKWRVPLYDEFLKAAQYANLPAEPNGSYVYSAKNKFRVSATPVAGAVENKGEKLPNANSGMSAFYNNGYIYLFGGQNGSTYYKSVVRYKPSSNTISTLSAELPTARASMAAVQWKNNDTYLFGGVTDSGSTAQILKFDGSAETVLTMTATLPTAVFGAAAAAIKEKPNLATDDRKIYVFGGMTGLAWKDTILEYDPSTDTIKTLTKKLPTPLKGAGAAAVGDKIYLFGGDTGQSDTDSRTKSIIEFDTYSKSCSVLDIELPEVATGISAVAIDDMVYLFGGGLGEIYAFNATQKTLSVADCAVLAVKATNGCAVAVDGNNDIYICGGVNTTTSSKIIYKFSFSTFSCGITYSMTAVSSSMGHTYQYPFALPVAYDPYANHFEFEIMAVELSNIGTATDGNQMMKLSVVYEINGERHSLVTFGYNFVADSELLTLTNTGGVALMNIGLGLTINLAEDIDASEILMTGLASLTSYPSKDIAPTDTLLEVIQKLRAIIRFSSVNFHEAQSLSEKEKALALSNLGTAALPIPTESDEGKILRVVDGKWAMVELPNAEEVSF